MLTAATGDATAAGPVDEEFVGPFPSWKNVKDFGAKGDGTTDDSNAIQAALTALKTVLTNAHSVLYFPAGMYRITKTLVTTRVLHNDYLGISIIGEDPANTTLVWDGAADQMMMRLDTWYAKVSRFTFDGKSKASVGLYRGDHFSTPCELSDLRFRDMATGIRFGGGLVGKRTGRHAVLRNGSSGDEVRDPHRQRQLAGHLDLVQSLRGLQRRRAQRRGQLPCLSERLSTLEGRRPHPITCDRSLSSATRPSVRRTSPIGRAPIPGARRSWFRETASTTPKTTTPWLPEPGPWLLVDNVIRNRAGYSGPSIPATPNDDSSLATPIRGRARSK